MAVGLFMSIKSSFIPEAWAAAESLVNGVNRGLTRLGFPRYLDPEPPPDVYRGSLFGRSSLDHHSARILALFGAVAARHGDAPHLSLLESNPYRVVYLPIDLPLPFQTGFEDLIGGVATEISAGSAPRLQRELSEIAGSLGIPLESGELSDSVAARLNNQEKFSESDSPALVDDYRTAWLLLYEGARLAQQHSTALALAG